MIFNNDMPIKTELQKKLELSLHLKSVAALLSEICLSFNFI